MRAPSIPLQGKFAKGFAGTKGENNVPIQYAAIAENIRISDQGITPRFGYSIVYEGNPGYDGQGIFAYENTQRLFRIYNQKFEEVNPVAGTITDRSSSLTLPTGKHYMFSYDIYIIICTGTTKPYIFNTATNTLTLTTTGIDDNVFPSFGAVFGNFTFLAYKNKLWMSLPVMLGSESNAISWNSGTTGTQQIVYKDYITSLKPTLDKLWISTDSFIEYIDANTVASVGTATNIFSVRFGQDQKMVNNDCVVPVGSKLFFVTKGNKIRSLGYTQGIAQLQISDLSDIPAVGVDYWMQQNLEADQSQAFGYFDDSENMIKRNFVKKGYTFPTVMLGYSLVNQCFVNDLGKQFGGACAMGSTIYTYSAHKDNKVFHNGVGRSDQGESYNCTYRSHYIKLGQARALKFFRGAGFGGKVNNFTNIKIESFVDGKTVMRPFDASPGSTQLSEGEGIAGQTIAGEPIAGSQEATNEVLNVRNKVITSSMVRAKGRGNARQLTMSGVGQDWIIDSMELFALAIGRYSLNDKF